MSDKQNSTNLDDCRTLLLDMDGTLLDLAYDNDLWLDIVPRAFAKKNSLSQEQAREQLYAEFRRLRGTLEWYCLDHWSERLGLDVFALHHERRAHISYLPGAEQFLKRAAAAQTRVLLATNSHRDTLALKAQQTGLDAYFDEIYSAHDLGYPKEEQGFWSAMYAAEGFEVTSTVFVDDNDAVLASAEAFGLRRLWQITQPDSRRPIRSETRYSAVPAVREFRF